MGSVELVRVVIRTASDIGSALRIWTDEIPSSEPSSVDTDEDGDTVARGLFSAGWLEIMREQSRVTLSYTPDEKVRQLQPLTMFDDDHAAVRALDEIVAQLAERGDFQRLELSIYWTDLFGSMQDSVARLREIAPGVFFPEGLADGNYKVSARRDLTGSAQLKLVVHGNWRNGKRGYTDTDDEDEVRHEVNGTSANIAIALVRKADTPFPENFPDVYAEMVEKAEAVRHGGPNAI